MPDGPLSPEEVAHRGFPTSFRGFDTGEVRAYLQRVANDLRQSVARERDLHKRVAEAEHRAAHPVIDNDTLTHALGDEMARILASTQEAAGELKTKAEENAARILREAHEQAQRIRAAAESVLADRTEEADAEAAEIRRVASEEAAGVLARARAEGEQSLAGVEERARQVVHEAQAARNRVLVDLTRRRRTLQTQVEQLRAGRGRLLEAYRLVRRTMDEVADELQRVEDEARDAAKTAGERVPEHEADELDDVLAAFPAPAELEGLPAPSGGGAGEETAGAALPASEPVGPVGPVEAVEAAGGGEPAAGDAAEPSPETPAEPVAASDREPGSPPGAADRRALRLLRRHRDGPPKGLEVVEGPAEAEGVRVIAAVPDPAAEPTAPAPVPESEAGEEQAAASEPGGSSIDDLFARIRAARADEVARAEEVLAAIETPAGEEPAPSPSEEAAEPAAAEPSSHAGGDEDVLQRRDQAVDAIEPRLGSRLKRALQDEQNEVLDRLRSAPRGAAAEALPAPADQAARYREAAREALTASALAGVAFVGKGEGTQPEVDDLAGDLADSLAAPLRRALERAVGSDGPDDYATLVERVGAAYRECKTQRIEGLAGDAVTAAFARGALAAMEPGAAARWVVDDDGRPCPDCDDNALAGPTPAGEAFPTGQAHPPAHAGCRCVIAPSAS